MSAYDKVSPDQCPKSFALNAETFGDQVLLDWDTAHGINAQIASHFDGTPRKSKAYLRIREPNTRVPYLYKNKYVNIVQYNNRELKISKQSLKPLHDENVDPEISLKKLSEIN